MAFKRAEVLHVVFKVGVIFKGIDAALEVIGAALVVRTSPIRLYEWVDHLTQHELSEDPNDFVANHLLTAARHYSMGQKTFAGAYLLSHGLIKILLVWALLARKLWAYPVAIVIFTAFGAYQLYRYSHSHSVAMIALTILDAVVILLTWVEYRRLRAVV